MKTGLAGHKTVIDKIDVQGPDMLLDVAVKLVSQANVRFDTPFAIPLCKNGVAVGKMYIAPSAWGSEEIVVVYVVGETENALVLSVPFSPIPPQTTKPAIKDVVIVEGTRFACALAASTLTALALSSFFPLTIAAAGGVVAASVGKRAGSVVFHFAPEVTERLGRRNDTFYSVSDWIGLFCHKKDVVICGKLSLGKPRGIIVYDTRSQCSGVYISGEVQNTLPAIRAFSKSTRVAFLCHNPCTGQVWYIGRRVICSNGHQIAGKRIRAAEISGDARTNSEQGNFSLCDFAMCEQC